ncbi:hypothetical protein M0805_001920 [Coniferiporia weirii]|nr:hypothetical protein M0805_001920 [Coniferiporia weirii]
MSTVTNISSEACFHPAYNAPDGDLVLLSCDGTLFRVHSLIMKMASSVFFGMLDLPRPSDDSSGEPIPVQEDAETLAALLDIVYPNKGFHTDPRLSFELYRRICIAADKYDMPAATVNLRNFFSAACQLFPPILMYGLANRLGWEEQAKLASSATLACNINSSESQEHLRTCDPDAILQLVDLHRLRRVQLVGAFDLGKSRSGCRFIPWDEVLQKDKEGKCCPCPTDHLPSSLLKAFLFKLSEEMEACPRGDFLRTRAFYNLPELSGLWNATCPIGCPNYGERQLLDKEKFIAKLLEELDSLPIDHSRHRRGAQRVVIPQFGGPTNHPTPLSARSSFLAYSP